MSYLRTREISHEGVMTFVVKSYIGFLAFSVFNTRSRGQNS